MAAGLNKFPAAHDDAVAAYELLLAIDPLRSGGEELAKRLKAAKVDVDEKTWGRPRVLRDGRGRVRRQGRRVVGRQAPASKSWHMTSVMGPG